MVPSWLLNRNCLGKRGKGAPGRHPLSAEQGWGMAVGVVGRRGCRQEPGEEGPASRVSMVSLVLAKGTWVHSEDGSDTEAWRKGLLRSHVMAVIAGRGREDAGKKRSSDGCGKERGKDGGETWSFLAQVMGRRGRHRKWPSRRGNAVCPPEGTKEVFAECADTCCKEGPPGNLEIQCNSNKKIQRQLLWSWSK